MNSRHIFALLFCVCLGACDDDGGTQYAEPVPEDTPDASPDVVDMEPDASMLEPDVPLPACQDDLLGPSAPERPHLLPVEEPAEGLVLCHGETDWFQVGLNDDDEIGVAVDIKSGPGARLTIADREGVLKEVSLAPGLQSLRVAAQRDGAVLVSLTPRSDERVVYDLSAAVITDDVPPMMCLDTAEEPNESPEAAFPIEAPTTFDTAVCPGDNDWYALEIPAEESVTVSIGFSHEAGDLDMRLYDALAPDAVIAASESATDGERFTAGPFDVDTTVLVHIFGFREAVGPYTFDAIAFGPPDRTSTTTGTVQFQDRLHDPDGFTGELEAVPGRQLAVEVVRLSDGAIVGSDITDMEGRFEIDFGTHEGESYRLQALAVVQVGENRARVRDRTNARAVYALTTDTFDFDEDPSFELLALADESIGGAMNIADSVGEGFRFIANFTDDTSPLLTVSWQRGEPFACGSCYSSNTISLGGQVEDPDQYDDDIILHEFGHYFVDHYSDDDSPGGSHRDRVVSPQLAYGEGLAYFFACMVQDKPDVIDNFLGDSRYIDLESVTQQMEDNPDFYGTDDGTVNGGLREEVVGGILWDAYDDASNEEPFDTVAIGADGHMAILLGPFGADGPPPDSGVRGIDLHDWLNTAACLFPEIAEPLTDLTEDRQWPWVLEEDLDCDFKGTHDPPWVLENRKDGLWLRGKDGATTGGEVVVWSFSKTGTSKRAHRCDALPCRIGDGVENHGGVAVVGLHKGERAATSLLGEGMKVTLLGGQETTSPSQGKIRLYRGQR